MWIYYGCREAGGLCDVHLLQLCECECECLCLLPLKGILDERARSEKERKMSQVCVSHICQTKSNNGKAHALHKSTRGWHENDDDGDDDGTETAIIWRDLLCFFFLCCYHLHASTFSQNRIMPLGAFCWRKNRRAKQKKMLKLFIFCDTRFVVR